ncbi:MAG TPA: FliA/WhiG family RNA polymerase sigma factor [Symbiobacteriaceae bacterium]|jgi:RNA polymerase sigma factor FliA|nr:FliA/WhiG family RNA polymerase sigma factor [Symbiobacteriaceae bacterium]
MAELKHRELWLRWRGDGDLAARDRLITEYHWLVRFVAGRLMVGMPPQFEQDDVEGHGCFGLLDAVAKFDPERGVRFETFAIPWIRGACLQGIRALQWAPALRKRVRELERAQAELELALGREPGRRELAQFLKLSDAELERRLAEVGCLSVLSLEETVVDGEGEGTSLQDRLADPQAIDPAHASALDERRMRLAEAIDGLPEQERLVVALFYHEGLMAREIGDLLGLSPSRISQIHSRAILRLRGKLSRMKELMVS